MGGAEESRACWRAWRPFAKRPTAPRLAFHLFGVTRCELAAQFARFGVHVVRQHLAAEAGVHWTTPTTITRPRATYGRRPGAPGGQEPQAQETHSWPARFRQEEALRLEAPVPGGAGGLTIAARRGLGRGCCVCCAPTSGLHDDPAGPHRPPTARTLGDRPWAALPLPRLWPQGGHPRRDLPRRRAQTGRRGLPTTCTVTYRGLKRALLD